MAGESVAFFEGRYMPLREAKISIVDPAITKSDIVFDVVSTTDRVFFRLDDHGHRFEISCRKIRVTLPVSGDEIKRISAECVHQSGFDDACVFMCGTRGLYRSGGVLGDPRDCDNGFYAYAVPYYYVVPRERIETGAHIWIAETRRAPNVAIDQTVKNFNRMASRKAPSRRSTTAPMRRCCSRPKAMSPRAQVSTSGWCAARRYSRPVSTCSKESPAARYSISPRKWASRRRQPISSRKN